MGFFYACNFQLKPDVLSKVYNEDNLQSQIYTIDSEKDTTLVGEQGTIVKIYANSFYSTDSTLDLSNIEIELKEAIKPSDFVLANLTTTSRNKMLQSGGMVFLDAKVNGKRLKVKSDAEIGVILPAVAVDKDMEIFKGYRFIDGSMVWSESYNRVLNSELQNYERSFITITYSCQIDSLPDSLLNAYLFQPEREVGDKTIIQGYNVEVVKIEKNLVALRESVNGLFIPDVITNKGRNGYVRDFNTSYIFSSSRLGWTNIDKFFDDPNAQEIDMVVDVTNQHDFDYVFTSMLLPELNSYISGYQKNDNTYGFTESDNEKMMLPTGIEATIMATAYRDDVPYFSMKKVIIDKSLNVQLSLSETTPEALKSTIETEI
tara:strand:- start:417 stop:1538 length:1122 start_codon:yes stop_codon:yes gene_type:complete